MNNTVILKEQVRKKTLIHKQQLGKGDDEKWTEMWQALDEIGMDKATELCNKIYDTGYIPDNMKVNINHSTQKVESREFN